MKKLTLCACTLAVSLCLLSPVRAGKPDNRGTRTFSLAIVGTDVEYDSSGFPRFLAGDLYDDRGRFVGRYEEDLQPVIHPEYGIIGATGVSVFSFTDVRGDAIWAQAYSRNLSMIAAVDPETGALLVNSSGEFFEGTGMFDQLSGGLHASSTIVLGSDFLLETDLELELSR